MADEQPTIDIAGKRVEDANFAFARLHAPNFYATKITDGWLRDADISGDIEGLRLNGVLVEPLIAAELDRLEPERVMLRATEPADLIAALDMLEDRWSQTIERARQLPPAELDRRVDDEWSFIETIRHLIMASDCWLGRMIKGEAMPWHPLGMAGSFLSDPAAIGLTYDARPTLDEVLAVRAGRVASLRETLATLDESSLQRMCVPPDDGNHPNEPHAVLQCVHVILIEEWEHRKYAERDLALLDARRPS